MTSPTTPPCSDLAWREQFAPTYVRTSVGRVRDRRCYSCGAEEVYVDFDPCESCEALLCERCRHLHDYAHHPEIYFAGVMDAPEDGTR